ncbi:MAG: sensor histidine kinase [Ignavibacteriales bacterium]|nr:sensor histidine kinase [Ignavibacteriales bacterium]
MNSRKLPVDSGDGERPSHPGAQPLRFIPRLPEPLATEFAPAERATREEILTQARKLPQIPLLHSFISSVFDIVLVLNKERQIVLANDKFYRFMGARETGSFLGQRFGEALQCVHANETPGGCGTSEFCRACGAIGAILSSQLGNVSAQEWHLARKDIVEPLDLRVYASPLKEDDYQFTIFAVSDISHEKRRRALERIFFHDVLNTAGGLRGFIELLKHSDSSEAEELKTPILELAQQLVEEIKAQRDLVAAENNELSITFIPTKSVAFMHEICDAYKNHDAARFKTLQVDSTSSEIEFLTDPTLLRRVVGNMVKNALEASGDNETIQLSSRSSKTGIEFLVHNPRFMPRHVQLQVFQRSFSTKGANRGLGTYSMKLLGEQYLRGKVTFTSFSEGGTTFKIWLPLVRSGRQGVTDDMTW